MTYNCVLSHVSYINLTIARVSHVLRVLYIDVNTLSARLLQVACITILAVIYLC